MGGVKGCLEFFQKFIQFGSRILPLHIEEGSSRQGAAPTALTGELSEYENIRQGNIAEREAMLQALMADFDRFKKDSGIGAAKKAPPKKRKRVEYDSGN